MGKGAISLAHVLVFEHTSFLNIDSPTIVSPLSGFPAFFG
jgi:hypothetical protein